VEGRDRRLRGSGERRRIGSSAAVRRSIGRSGAGLAGRIRLPAGARRSRPASLIRSRQLLLRCRLVPSPRPVPLLTYRLSHGLPVHDSGLTGETRLRHIVTTMHAERVAGCGESWGRR
jgi:hypothetical protein